MDVRNNINIEEIRESTKRALERLLPVAGLRPGQILVVGCSTSEVLGYKIGSHSSLEIAAPIYEALREAVSAQSLYLAVQCCEHLNRALVVERECMEKYNLEEVGVVPHPRAGGSRGGGLSSRPVVVSPRSPRRSGYRDTFIGCTCEGGVPVRSEVKYIGNARTMAGSDLSSSAENEHNIEGTQV